MNGSVSLEEPVAQDLLRSMIPARVAYTGLDGEPRVVPIWFLWRAGKVLLFAHAQSYKARAIAARPSVALTIDSETPPYRFLNIRGTATVTPSPAGDRDAFDTTVKYIGAEAAGPFAERKAVAASVRIAITPEKCWFAEL